MRRLVPLALLAGLAAGCGGGGTAAGQGSTSGWTAYAPLARNAAPETPGGALRRFAASARSGDAQAMWAELSRRSRARLGPSEAAFARHAAVELSKGPGSFPAGTPVVLSEEVADGWGLAALAGARAYGAALHREGGAWRVDLGGRVQVTPLSPQPGTTHRQPLQLAAGIAARQPLVDGGLWLDGAAFAGQSGGTDPSHLTFYGTTGARLTRGRHTVVGFARTASDGTARAWTFRVS